uniref:Anoctamin transmembrane domain-containing protein n=1 Tax=Chromera velia CCMP2878 TaxID=1169474 RepID=A0A0G4F4V9_9ALVE|eukprot:Cvel_15163.t1-p1 / transcript=Cvel_15163.t1 / gene=Cvel_15163 / organism=Chromera_velia_CCMP2878 / gene_product=hypothetical protein / transcript_product=hypothetical protein / location=Cvel_scaffold1107:34179-52197(+) / protein_length=1712 / sequence_SO=supercontig / SO=protein_coding / is_pseudo=false
MERRGDQATAVRQRKQKAQDKLRHSYEQAVLHFRVRMEGSKLIILLRRGEKVTVDAPSVFMCSSPGSKLKTNLLPKVSTTLTAPGDDEKSLVVVDAASCHHQFVPLRLAAYGTLYVHPNASCVVVGSPVQSRVSAPGLPHSQAQKFELPPGRRAISLASLRTSSSSSSSAGGSSGPQIASSADMGVGVGTPISFDEDVVFLRADPSLYRHRVVKIKSVRRRISEFSAAVAAEEEEKENSETANGSKISRRRGGQRGQQNGTRTGGSESEGDTESAGEEFPGRGGEKETKDTPDVAPVLEESDLKKCFCGVLDPDVIRKQGEGQTAIDFKKACRIFDDCFRGEEVVEAGSSRQEERTAIEKEAFLDAFQELPAFFPKWRLFDPDWQQKIQEHKMRRARAARQRPRMNLTKQINGARTPRNQRHRSPSRARGTPHAHGGSVRGSLRFSPQVEIAGVHQAPPPPSPLDMEEEAGSSCWGDATQSHGGGGGSMSRVGRDWPSESAGWPSEGQASARHWPDERPSAQGVGQTVGGGWPSEGLSRTLSGGRGQWPDEATGSSNFRRGGTVDDGWDAWGGADETVAPYAHRGDPERSIRNAGGPKAEPVSVMTPGMGRQDSVGGYEVVTGIGKLGVGFSDVLGSSSVVGPAHSGRTSALRQTSFRQDEGGRRRGGGAMDLEEVEELRRQVEDTLFPNVVSEQNKLRTGLPLDVQRVTDESLNRNFQDLMLRVVVAKLSLHCQLDVRPVFSTDKRKVFLFIRADSDDLEREAARSSTLTELKAAQFDGDALEPCTSEFVPLREAVLSLLARRPELQDKSEVSGIPPLLKMVAASFQRVADSPAVNMADLPHVSIFLDWWDMTGRAEVEQLGDAAVLASEKRQFLSVLRGAEKEALKIKEQEAKAAQKLDASEKKREQAALDKDKEKMLGLTTALLQTVSHRDAETREEWLEEWMDEVRDKTEAQKGCATQMQLRCKKVSTKGSSEGAAGIEEPVKVERTDREVLNTAKTFKGFLRLLVELPSLGYFEALTAANVEAEREAYKIRNLWGHLAFPEPPPAFAPFSFSEKLEPLWKRETVDTDGDGTFLALWTPGQKGVWWVAGRLKILSHLIDRQVKIPRLLQHKVAEEFFPLDSYHKFESAGLVHFCSIDSRLWPLTKHMTSQREAWLKGDKEGNIGRQAHFVSTGSRKNRSEPVGDSEEGKTAAGKREREESKNLILAEDPPYPQEMTANEIADFVDRQPKRNFMMATFDFVRTMTIHTPLDAFRAYFGEKVAFYFAFLVIISSWRREERLLGDKLLRISVGAAIIAVLVTSSATISYWLAILRSVWTKEVEDAWKAYNDGGQEGPSPRETVKWYIAKENATTVTSVIDSLSGTVFTSGGGMLVIALCDWYNVKFKTTYEALLAYEAFAIQVTVKFWPFVLTAFFKPAISVRESLATQKPLPPDLSAFVSVPLEQNASRVLDPSVPSPQDGDGRAQAQAAPSAAFPSPSSPPTLLRASLEYAASRQLQQPVYTTGKLDGAWSDYKEVDAIKVFHLVRRPTPEDADSIGPWIVVLDAIFVLAVTCNALLLVYVFGSLDFLIWPRPGPGRGLFNQDTGRHAAFAFLLLVFWVVSKITQYNIDPTLERLEVAAKRSEAQLTLWEGKNLNVKKRSDAGVFLEDPETSLRAPHRLLVDPHQYALRKQAIEQRKKAEARRAASAEKILREEQQRAGKQPIPAQNEV